MFTLGNEDILKLHKTAFLCSRKYPSSIVPRAYDWAIAQREAGNCVISGFHSQIEKDVFHYLLKGRQPIVLALARGLPERIEPALRPSIDTGRLLLVTPFGPGVSRVISKTAQKRNRMMVDMADDIVVGYASPDGSLAALIRCAAPREVSYLSDQKHES
jgi:predicted Rossmann fold nucleotide-binding protein DprA/Smf involved in DNA uptake